ncbi:alpha/beta hydrolase [Streptosporangium sp. 'caverna']|uniref:alpha/beta hydrolase n=1 Tax=Streptosporangium sp. 'caverna' TaxID=2202249 RepID=UPI0013A6CFE9|nr:alpha/beta hydrolase [Streptosporangium sp. 'caverna']
MRAAHDVVETCDVVYRQAGDADLRLDLYVPEGGTSRPSVVYVHGGAWLMGGRREFSERFVALARAGVAVASIDYRTIDRGPYPRQRDDILGAIDWVTEHGAAYGLSTDRAVLMGASAGAHLSALAAFAAPDRVAGFVGLFGRYDLTSAGSAVVPASHLQVPEVIRKSVPPPGFEGLDHRARLALLAGVEPGDLSEAVLGGLSPLAQVHAGAPAVLLAHGTGDAVVHHSHSVRLAEALVSAGTREEVSVMLLPGANHEDPVFAGARFLDGVAEFVHRCTAQAGARLHS